MAETIYELLRGIPPWLAVFVLAMVPVTELRGAIPLAIVGLDMPPLDAFGWALAGNLVITVALVLLLEPVATVVRQRIGFVDRLFDKLFDRTRSRHGKTFERFRDVALVAFVAVPLPGTGGWSGALASWVFGVPSRRAVPLVCLGVTIAGVAVTALVVSGLFVLGIDRP